MSEQGEVKVAEMKRRTSTRQAEKKRRIEQVSKEAASGRAEGEVEGEPEVEGRPRRNAGIQEPEARQEEEEAEEEVDHEAQQGAIARVRCNEEDVEVECKKLTKKIRTIQGQMRNLALLRQLEKEKARLAKFRKSMK